MAGLDIRWTLHGAPKCWLCLVVPTDWLWFSESSYIIRKNSQSTSSQRAVKVWIFIVAFLLDILRKSCARNINKQVFCSNFF